MATAEQQQRIELLKEAHKRGILPEDKKPLFDEAVKRGLIKLEPADEPEKSFMKVISEGFGTPFERSAKSFSHALFGAPTKEEMATQKEITEGGKLRFAKGVVGTGQGVKQFSLEAMEKMGMIPKGSAQAYTEKTDAEKKLFMNEFNKEFGDRWQFTVAETGGAIAPMLAISPALTATTAKVASLTPKLQGFLGTTALGAGSGSMFGATQYIPKDAEESRLYKTLEAAGWGASLAALFNIMPALRNKFRDLVGKSLKKKEATKALELSQRTGIEFKARQISDDPVVQQMDELAGRTIAGERASSALATKQIKQTLNYWMRTANKLSKGKTNFGKHIEKTFNKTLGSSTEGTGLLGARAKQAKADFAAVDKASGGKRMIKLDNFKDKATKLINEWKHSADPEKRKAARQILSVLRRTSSRTGSGAREWKTNATKMQDLLETYGGAAKGSGNILKDIDPKIQRQASSALFGKLQKDLNVAIKSGVRGSRELKLARDNYQMNSKAIDALQKSALNKFFKGSEIRSAEGLEQTFIKMDAGDIKGVMGVLEKTDPGMRGRLQKFWIENQLKKSAITEGFDKQIFSPHKMLELTSGLRRDTFKAVFDSGAARKQVMDGIRATQRIIVANSKTSAQGGSFLQKMAGVAASRDPTFVARLSAEVLAPKTIAAYVNSKEGVMLLRTLAKTRNTSAGAAILIKLNNLRKEQQEE